MLTCKIPSQDQNIQEKHLKELLTFSPEEEDHLKTLIGRPLEPLSALRYSDSIKYFEGFSWERSNLFCVAPNGEIREIHKETDPI